MTRKIYLIAAMATLSSDRLTEGCCVFAQAVIIITRYCRCDYLEYKLSVKLICRLAEFVFCLQANKQTMARTRVVKPRICEARTCFELIEEPLGL